jgi:hypothetical protein
LISDVSERYSSGASHIREAFRDAKAGIAQVKEAVSSGTAKKSAPVKKAAKKKAAKKTNPGPVKKLAVPAKKTPAPVRKLPAPIQKPPAPVQSATKPAAQVPVALAPRV